MEAQDQTAAAVAKDEQAFAQWMEAESRRLYGIAYAYLHHEADALEAVQETVSRAWSKRESVRNPEYFTTWVTKILIRVCIDALHQRKRAAGLTMRQKASGQILSRSASPSSEESDLKLDVRRALEQLDTKYRHIVTLKYFCDMTIQDIAKLLRKPDGTIKTWLNKALKQLRNSRHLEAGEEERGGGEAYTGAEDNRRGVAQD